MKRTGFTLIEVLIVIAVIAILAAIVVPRLLGAARIARETSLKAHLQVMRNALGKFEADCGCYPDELGDILATVAPKSGTNGVKIKPSKFKGPYLTNPDGALPNNPITGSNVVGIPGLMGDDPVDWIYDPSQGTGPCQGRDRRGRHELQRLVMEPTSPGWVLLWRGGLRLRKSRPLLF
jgi:general secretion pathway protein G